MLCPCRFQGGEPEGGVVTSNGPLSALGFSNPVMAAPMSGGPSTPALVIAARRAQAFGFLAGGYKTAETLAAQMNEVRDATEIFGVNLFAPNPVPVDPNAYRSYAAAIQREGRPYGLDPLAVPLREDDDDWTAKVELLIDDPVSAVSFTFGIPDIAVIKRLRQVGSVIIQTVTSAAEAAQAAAAGVDALVVQSHDAGGHLGTLTPGDPPPPVPLTELVAEVRASTGLPLIAAGGVATPSAVQQVLSAGAEAAAVGTYLLRTDESGASVTYKSALAAKRDVPTAVTRAFSGRPARGITNQFMERYGAIAPLGYPAIHHLTTPIRRAAAESGDPERINLWAGTGHSLAPDGSAAEALGVLGSRA